MTPRPSDTAFMPASLPDVIFTSLTEASPLGLLHARSRGPHARSRGSVLSFASSHIGKPVVLHQRGVGCLRDDLVDRQVLLGALDVSRLRARRGMTRREQRAAVLIRDDRDGIRPGPLPLRRDLVLVHPHEPAPDGPG